MEIVLSDRKLIKDCLNGNREAQFKLYNTYAKAMYNICFRLLQNEADAEDVLQNSFVDVFTKLYMFNFESTPGAWIKRVVINQCINHLRKRKMIFEEIDQIKEEQDTLYEDPNINVALIKHSIDQLPEGYRVVFSLFALEGYDHGEIAQILDISESTSKSQYSRAKVKLKTIMQSHGGIENYFL